MQWNYKIDLQENAIAKDEKALKVTFPEDLKKFIEATNGASPEKYCVKIGDTECVYGGTLSFNPDESEADDVFTANAAINRKNIIPFGIDPFGNYFCYDLTSHQVLFWNHEEDDFKQTHMTLEAFVNSFYE